MYKLLLLGLVVSATLTSTPAEAKHHHAHHGHHHTVRGNTHHSFHHRVGRHRTAGVSVHIPSFRERFFGLTTVKTEAGPITVANNLVDKFKGFIHDLHQEGYTPHHVGCYAAGGHVAHSNHYHGGACDFDQTGRNRTASHMYHVSSLAAKWGLRDGCSFHDCGHIDDGMNVGWHKGGGSSYHRRFARHRHHRLASR